MSGILNEAATPCPSRSKLGGRNSGSDMFDSLLDDESAFEHTGQIEFTTEVRPSVLTGARPRRATRAGSAFQVHEDNEKPTGPAEKRRRPNGVTRPPSDRKSSLLAQPAQRFRPKVNFAPSPPPRAKNLAREKQRNPEGLRPRASENILSARRSKTNFDREEGKDGLKKDVRRGTVYIPPDDTTVASVFMDLFSPLKKNSGVAVPENSEETRINSLEAQIAKRQARKSLAVSARKAPLQPSSKIAQEAAIRVDIAGKNGGKENIPPGRFVDLKDEGAKSNRASVASGRQSTGRKATHPSTKPTNRTALGERQSNAKPPVSRVNKERDVVTETKQSLRNSSILNARASTTLSEKSSHSAENCASSRTASKPSKSKRLNREYPLLAEDIPRPALYDDDWLSHQETVITQLVNSLFECTDDTSTSYDPATLRLELLELYHTDYFTHLHRRVQASLSCGTLSVPKDLLARSSRLKQDIGLRRKFLDIWTQSYDPRALAAAAETIVGRRVSSEPVMFTTGDTPHESAVGHKKTIIRKLEGFLDTFLLRNEDMDPSSERRETPAEASAKAYRRTLLRSVMLVVLLDQGRQSPATTVPRRLFLSSSPFKSSVEVLQALARLLLPSCGDIAKPLGHLGCQLSFKQHPLQEYDYQVENIAVDFRDGVRLTRLIEVFFFLSENARSPNHTEVFLCTGEVLSLRGDGTDLPLSQHLKFPCVSRAAKVFNVQIALSALGSVRGSSKMISDLQADNIVDGYREKTIALLWALVSKWGLAGLVDWDDLSKEIERLKCKAVAQLGYEKSKDEAWFSDDENSDLDGDEHARLLQKWASVLAALKGLRINNMTTSFADGRIYESVVDEYEPYIMPSNDHDNVLATGTLLSNPLESRLRALGCSSQFAFLVSPDSASSHILDRDFTLAALAFLCSRLLSASRRARAATTLQRAWRGILAERYIQRREIAKSLAVQCAAVVQTRNEILWAKEVITTWWRKAKARKQQRLSAQYRPTRKLDRPARKGPGRRL